jgi:hypothetical protein
LVELVQLVKSTLLLRLTNKINKTNRTNLTDRKALELGSKDLYAQMRYLHWYYLHRRPFIQPFGIDIDFKQTVGEDHCADEA